MFERENLCLVTWGQWILAAAASVGIASAQNPATERGAEVLSIHVGQFPVEVLHVFSTSDGLPANDVACLFDAGDGEIIAGTGNGLARRVEGKWQLVGDQRESVLAIAALEDNLLIVQGDSLVQCARDGHSAKTRAKLPPNAATTPSVSLAVSHGRIYLGNDVGLFALDGERLVPVEEFARLTETDKAVRQLAAGPHGELAVAASAGLFLKNEAGEWERPTPRQGKRSWAPNDVRGVAFDRGGRLWFASPQGVGCRDGSAWTLYTGSDGLPYDDFTCIAPGEEGVVWFGTKKGAIRFDGQHWNYRRSRRWLPNDEVRGIAVESDGNAWFATPEGVGLLERRPMTLADKAKFYEDEIDKYHRRTPYGYVGGVSTGKPGEKVEIQQHDSDNDGLWTAMYGAGECFAYAATKDPEAKRRATAAFEALRFLSHVTQGGPHPAPKGFPARSILPTDGPDPNERPRRNATVNDSARIRIGKSSRRAGRSAPTANGTGKPTPVPTNWTGIISCMRCITISWRRRPTKRNAFGKWCSTSRRISSITTTSSSITTACRLAGGALIPRFSTTATWSAAGA